MIFFRKYHKWLGIILAFFIISFAISGIILNHRKLFAFVNVNRKYLPKQYEYNNWDNSSVKSTLKISKDSILIYGNIGIWLTNSNFNKFTDFTAGYPKGIDNKKICKIYLTKKHQLLSGSFFGLYNYDFNSKKWQKIILPVKEERIADITEKQDTLLILTRSHLLKTTDLQNFQILVLPPPENYDNKVGLFKTLWVIHSGEIYGLAGKIIVDIVGLIFTFLTLTGIIIFINKNNLKKSRISLKQKLKFINSNKWNLKWHNKIGWISTIILLITASTGIFLRPPFLIAIANSRVNKIPYSELATPNPWFDKLRRIMWDQEAQRYIIATNESLYYSDDNFHSKLKKFKIQPPVSVMGVNVFRKYEKDTYLIGSFEGLFLWNPNSGMIFDYIKKEPYTPKNNFGRPIGEFLVTGYSTDYNNEEICFTYNYGAININKGKKFVSMPKKLRNSPISLWNVALEVHTGRIYENLLGGFYILIVPLAGLGIIFIIISGFIVWYRTYKKRKQNNKSNKQNNKRYMKKERII